MIVGFPRVGVGVGMIVGFPPRSTGKCGERPAHIS